MNFRVTLSRVNRFSILLIVSLALLLPSCGGGGGGNGGAIPLTDPNRVGAGWITITGSYIGTSGSTGPSTVTLSGDAFISPKWWHCCSGSGSDTGVTVSWVNSTTGVSGQANQTPEYCGLFGTSYLCGHKWRATVELAVGNNVIAITATDPDGNLGRVTTTVVGTPDNVPPTVVATNPSNGASAVATNRTITVTFSEAMDPSSVSATTILLKDKLNNAISGSITYSNRIATFSPSSSLLGNTNYTVTVTTGVRDVAGNPLATPLTWNFTTGVAPDTTPPTISATSPPTGGCAATETSLYATFTEAVQGLNANTFLLKDSSNNPIGGNVGIDYLGRGYFSPNSMLINSANYTATLTTGIMDLAGNHISRDYTWSFVTPDAGAGNWGPTSTSGVPTPRSGHTAVWTGTQMIVWGGNKSVYVGYLSDGARYNPATDSWSPLSTVGAPFMTTDHVAVWTGSKMLIWSGNGGAIYDPATDSWTAMSMSGAPSPRSYPTAAWTGTEMIIWGGKGVTSNQFLSDGARYNPLTDSWSPISTSGAPSARYGHTAIWTGSTMIIWGGTTNIGFTNTGGIYTPASDSWIAIPATGAPSARTSYSAVWTGSEMIIWGGRDIYAYDSGARYSPSRNSWHPMSSSCQPMARFGHIGIWSGTEMIVWGGADNPNGPYFKEGGRYNPITDTWQATNVIGMPNPRMGHTGVWTGTELIVWGGYDNSGINYTLTQFNSGGRYRPQ